MSEVEWCASRLREVSGLLEEFSSSKKLIVSSFSDAKGSWRDSAAKKFYDKHLEPFQDELESLEKHSSAQLVILSDALNSMREGDQLERRSLVLSDEVQEAIDKLSLSLIAIGAKIVTVRDQGYTVKSEIGNAEYCLSKIID